MSAVSPRRRRVRFADEENDWFASLPWDPFWELVLNDYCDAEAASTTTPVTRHVTTTRPHKGVLRQSSYTTTSTTQTHRPPRRAPSRLSFYRVHGSSDSTLAADVGTCGWIPFPPTTEWPAVDHVWQSTRPPMESDWEEPSQEVSLRPARSIQRLNCLRRDDEDNMLVLSPSMVLMLGDEGQDRRNTCLWPTRLRKHRIPDVPHREPSVPRRFYCDQERDDDHDDDKDDDSVERRGILRKLNCAAARRTGEEPRESTDDSSPSSVSWRR